jgi:hypothetical protein
MSDKQDGKSFWTTIPGILTGCAALITAIGTIITVLYTVGPLASHSTTPTAVSTSAKSQATEIPIVFVPTLTPTFLPTAPKSSPTTEVSACSIQVGQLGADAWANAQVRSSLKCPVNAQHSIDSAVEAFEQGFMLWRKDTGRLYAFFYDGTWEDFPNTFLDGIDPEYSCGSPSSPPSPRRGFSLVWCNQSRVHLKLGNAVEREQGFCMSIGDRKVTPCDTFQDFENGMMYRSIRFNKLYVAFTDSRIWQQW